MFRLNAAAKVMPSGRIWGRLASVAGVMLTGVAVARSPGGTATIDPSLPSTTPPAAPNVTVPVWGVCTSTGMTVSAGPLMIVTVACPGLTADISPSGVIVTMPGGLTKYRVPELAVLRSVVRLISPTGCTSNCRVPPRALSDTASG